MSSTDLNHFTGFASTRVTFEVKSDNGWVDLNTRHSAGGSDYWACLKTDPIIDVSVEDVPGVYVARLSSVTLRNRNGWAGKEYGFWEAPYSISTPLTIRRKSETSDTFTVYSFSGWRGRKVRIGVDVFGPDGQLLGNYVRGLFRIKNVICDGETAVLELSSYNFPMTKKSAALLKNGTDPFKNLTIGANLRLLAKFADPELEVVVDEPLDFGLLDNPRCSSWGAAPGVLDDNTVSVNHWIPRCFEPDQSDDECVLVGFEVPGVNQRSDGALARFNVVTGKWTILYTPEETLLQECWPITMVSNSGGTVYVIVVREKPLDGSFSGFYEIAVLQTDRDGTSIQTNASWLTYWPARWSLRKGTYHDFSGTKVFLTGHWSGDYHGEMLCTPFPQLIDVLSDFMYPGTRDLHTPPYDDRVMWHGLTQKNNTTTEEFDGYGAPALAGFNATLVGTTSSSAAGAFRFWITDQYHPPIIYEESSILYAVFVRTTPGATTWSITRVRLSNGTTEHWAFGLGGTTPLYDRQITAYALAPALTSASNKILVATVNWEEGTQSGTPPLATSVLYEVDLTDHTPPLVATSVARFTNTPTDAQDPSDCSSIVGIFTPWATNQYRKQTAGYSVMTILNRGNASGGSYGIGVYKNSTHAFILRHNDGSTDNYHGPISSRPFANFFTDPEDDNIFYFTDQASGQMRKGIVDLTAETVTFLTENNAFPVHSSEFSVSSVGSAAVIKPAVDDVVRYIFSTAPGPHGDVSNEYWERQDSSISRREVGLYPVVMFSKAVADAIEVSDFTATCWKESVFLKQLAPKYRYVLGSDGVLRMTKRIADPSAAIKLVRRTNVGVADVVGDEFPFDRSSDRRILYDEIINNVVITPWTTFSKGDVSAKTVRAAGSTFGGQFVLASNSERQTRVAITCVVGGDVQEGADLSQQPALLWRWTRTNDTITSYLSVACSDTDVSIQIGGVRVQSDGTIFAGQQRIRIGDIIQVSSGERRQISSFGAIGTNSVTISLNGDTGVNAAAYSVVTITPSLIGTASDSEEGVTGLAAGINDTQTSIEVKDPSQIRVGMILQIVNDNVKKSEYVSVESMSGPVLFVKRGVFGSVANSFTASLRTRIRAFLSTRKLGRLYEVGDTGINFGVDVDSNTDKASRTVSPSDGVIATAPGYALQAMEYARLSREDADSKQANDVSEVEIKDNHFISPLFAEVISISMIDEFAEPRLGVQISMPWHPSIVAGATVIIDDSRLVAGALGDVQFEVVGVSDDLANKKMTVRLRSFDAVSGAGARSVATAPSGSAAHAGGDRRR